MQLAIFCDQTLAKGSYYQGTYLNEKISNNQFLINIPIFQTSQATKVYAWATMCYEQGSSNIYSPNEIIVIDFINDEVNYPIIVGKLYKTTINNNSLDNKNITLNKKVNSLMVTGDSTFNKDGFNLATYNDRMEITSYKTGLDLVNAIDIIQELQQKVFNLEKQIENLKNKILT